MADQNLQYPTFYHPNPNSPQVYDAQGNAIDLATYKQATGQTDVPDNEVNWQFIQQVPVPSTSQVNSADVWNLPGAAQLKNSLAPATQALMESMYKVSQGQIAAGGVGNFDPETFNKALNLAATDPQIKSTYGDAAALAQQNLAFQLQQITGNQLTGQAALQATQQQQQQALQQQIASAGGVVSGFNKQAKNELAAQQADIIQSTRSQLQQQIQQLGQGYESQFGSAFPGTAGSSSITAGGPLTGQVTYQPVGGITGTQNAAELQAKTTAAGNYLPQVSSTGVLK
jgi:hypothetical protein